MKFFFTKIFPLIFVLVGACVGFVGIRGLVRAGASNGWPKVSGSILSSDVDRHRSSSSSSSGSSTTYHAEIAYEFTVDGVVYDGDRVAYGDYGSSNSSHARKIVRRYPVGKKVTVCYMPGNPEECLLEPGVKAQSFFMPAFGSIFFLVGLGMLFALSKAVKNQQQGFEPEQAYGSDDQYERSDYT